MKPMRLSTQRRNSRTPRTHFRIDVDPVPENNVAVRAFGFECVIVKRAHLFDRAEFRKPEIQDRLDAVVAEVLRHLSFGMIAWL
jgi:hypothetical protein